MKNECKVSIIVPIYNVEAYLPRCIESLVSQTLEDIEIILVNDGSPDNCQAIMDDYQKQYPELIRCYTKPNGGLSDARNYGMQFAKGEYIGFVDSDDYIDDRMYQKMYETALEEDAEMVICAYYGVNELTNSKKLLQSGNMNHFGKSIFDNPKLLYINAPYAWNKLVKREVWERTQMTFPKGLIYEDISTMYPLMLSVNKIAKVNEPLYYYILQREGSITGTYSPKSIELIDSLARLNNYFLEHGYLVSFRRELQFINIKHIYNRFYDFDEYNHKEFQLEFMKKGFEHLYRFFPNWKEDTFYFDFVLGKKKNFKRKLYQSETFWKYVIKLPNGLTSIPSKLGKLKGKSKRAIRNMKKVKDRSRYMRYVYAWHNKHSKIKKNTVLFESFHGTNISDSPFFMMKELRKDKNFKIYCTTNQYELHKEYLKKNGFDDIKLVKLGRFKYAKLLATCEYLVNNVSFPIYYMKREGQKHFNTWHGTPLKTLGKNMSKGIESMHNIQHNFLQSDLLMFPNEFTRDVMMEDYNLSELYTGKTVITGYPRNAIFKDEEAGKKLRRKLGIDDKMVYAYMPTWRGNNSISVSAGNYRKQLEAILNYIDTRLKDNQLLYVNLHPIMQKRINLGAYRHIRKFPADINNYEFLNATDALITDYSSVFFDYSVTKKPIIMFMYDYEEYMEDRGTYFEAKSLPFTQVYSTEELTDILVNEKIYENDYSNDVAYRNQYIPYDSLDATRKLVDYFFYGKEGDLKIEDYAKNKEKQMKVCWAKRITTHQQLEDLVQQYNSKNTVFVFQQNHFSLLLNELLFKEYNRQIVYIVISNVAVITFGEKIASYFKKDEFRKQMDQQQITRCIPNIKVEEIIKPEN